MQTVIGQFYTTVELDEVKEFFADKGDLGSIKRGVKKGYFNDQSYYYYLRLILGPCICLVKGPEVGIQVKLKSTIFLVVITIESVINSTENINISFVQV